ncbi:MAG: hypothetical protein HYT41_00870 [Candidatus Sungbacteria bacterium]|nr:hypothetical protein [Candidatus Sungbacteria bacterium]
MAQMGSWGLKILKAFKQMLGQDQSHNLLALFGLASVSPEEQEKFLTEASEKILEAEEKAAFFRTYMPDFRDILLAEVERFQREALAHAGVKNL